MCKRNRCWPPVASISSQKARPTQASLKLLAVAYRRPFRDGIFSRLGGYQRATAGVEVVRTIPIFAKPARRSTKQTKRVRARALFRAKSSTTDALWLRRLIAMGGRSAFLEAYAAQTVLTTHRSERAPSRCIGGPNWEGKFMGRFRRLLTCRRSSCNCATLRHVHGTKKSGNRSR
jgi:hypothetical protein